jgi:hypothetical protein
MSIKPTDRVARSPGWPIGQIAHLIMSSARAEDQNVKRSSMQAICLEEHFRKADAMPTSRYYRSSLSDSTIWHKPRSLRRSGPLGFDERNNNLIELIWFLQIH